MSATASDPAIEGEAELGGPTVESTDSGVQGNGSPDISRDDLFDVLSNHRRRYALHSLKQCDGGVDIGDLTEEIAAWENDVSIAELTAAQRKRVYTALQQFHLPKMDSTGIVAFDSDRGIVTLTEASANLDIYLDVVTEDNIPWSRYYLGLSAMSLAAVAVVALGVAPFTLLSGVAWAAFVAVAFLISSLAHTYSNRRMRLGAAGGPAELRER